MSDLAESAIVGSAILGIATVVLGRIMLGVIPSSAELSAGFRSCTHAWHRLRHAGT